MGHWLVFLTAWAVASACSRGEPTVLAVAVHPTNSNIVYVSASHGVLKTRDGGLTWSAISEGLEHSQVRAFAIDPTAPSTIYAGTFANAIYKSADGGQRWRPANVGMKEHVSVVNALTMYPPNPQIIYAATTVGPYRSENGGETWEERVRGMESVYTVAIAFDPRFPEVLYAGTSGGMYKSRDRGARWELLNRGLIEGEVGTAMALGVNAISVDPQDTNRLVIATGKGIFVSSDGGARWESRSVGSVIPFMTAVQRDPGDRMTLYAGGDHGIFVSRDGGDTWTAVAAEPSPRVVRALAVDPSSPGVVYAGTHKGLLKSTDDGATWSRIEGLR
jgi:photosystem II stability/assembly factor-like uncharacterized protein